MSAPRRTSKASRDSKASSQAKPPSAAVDQDILIYRGYEIHDLADHATFEEVAYLLLVGEKPTTKQLADFKQQLVAHRELPHHVIDYLATHPHARSTLRRPNGCPAHLRLLLGNLDPDSASQLPRGRQLRKALRLTAQIPTMIGHMQNVIDGRDIIPARSIPPTPPTCST
jgi:citrate synthase